MTKSQALVPQFDSHKKKKLKLSVEEIICVQDERKEEMNGKKKKKKKRKADNEVCVYNSTLSFDCGSNNKCRIITDRSTYQISQK